jgi:hypothetical protein
LAAGPQAGENGVTNGYRVFDSDTPVNPAARVLERYVDEGFRPRRAELAHYRLPVAGAADGGNGLRNYRAPGRLIPARSKRPVWDAGLYASPKIQNAYRSAII